MREPSHLIAPLGDRALTVRFSDTLTLAANGRAIAAAQALARAELDGVEEIVPNLVSVFVRYDPGRIAFPRLCGEIGLVLATSGSSPSVGAAFTIPVRYGGADGPDLDAAAQGLAMSADAFVAQHAQVPLRVLAVGFAPGFVYCGLHEERLRIARRRAIRRVRAGAILFAAGQTAVCATPIPTGWSVIGHTERVMFAPEREPPCLLAPGDHVRFEAVGT